MKTPGSIFALTKAAQNRMFSEAIADKYENAGISPYVGVSLVFLNLKQNQILRENTKETIQIIYQLMLQWNNRQDFPLAGTTVFSHIRENIEYDLQTLRCENRELYRELNSIWQEIRVIDRREAAAAGKKRANRRQDYFQKERRKWNEKLETALTLVKQTAVQAPAELRPADVCKAIISRLDKRQSLQTEIREPGITGTKFLGQEALGTGTPGTEAETRLKNFSGRFTGFIYRDSFRELYRMLEHRMPGDEQRLPGETQRIIQQNQVLAGMQEVPAGLQTINRIVNQQVNRQINRQPLWTEELTHRIVESREAGILEVEFSGAKTLGTGTPGAEIPGINAPGTKAETRLKNLREIFTGFIYRDSFRELHRMLEHRLPGMERRQSGDEHRLPGETQRIMRQREALAGTQGIPAGTQEVPAGIQTINRIANQQISQQVNRQISRRLLRTTEELTHQITENREEGSPGTEFPGGKTLGTGIPWAEIPGINALRTETETRQISLSERFTGFLYHGSVRELHRMPEHRLPGMERRQSGDEHQPPGVERRLTGEIQRIVRQNEALAGTQGIPAGTQAVPAGIQTINRIANQQISQQINRQISQQVNRQINRRLLRTTEELTHRITENRKAGGPGTEFPGEKALGTGVPGAEVPGINALRTEAEIRLNRTIHTEYLDAQKRYFRIVRKELLPLEIKAARLEGLLGRGRPPRTNGRTRPDTGTIRDRQAETERLRHREAIRNKITVLDDIHLLKTISERQRTDGNGRKFSAAENFLRMRPALTAAQTLKTQAAAEAAQPLKYRTKGQSDRKAPGQEAFLDNLHTELQYLKKKEATGEEALREQKQNVKVLTEKINIQEQAIHQMKNAGQGQTSALGKAEVKMVADAVLERLQKDIHLQRLRMGMS